MKVPSLRQTNKSPFSTKRNQYLRRSTKSRIKFKTNQNWRAYRSDQSPAISGRWNPVRFQTKIVEECI